MQQMDVQLGAVKVHLAVMGQGRPVLMLHGWGGSHVSWAPVWQQLSAHHTLYIPDFPGFGQSDPPEAPWDVAAYAQMVCHLMDALDLKKCDFVVHSFGGRVLLKLASEHPERVGRAVITDGAGLKPKRGAKYYFKVYSYKLCKWLARALGPLGRGWRDRMAQRAGSEDYRALSPLMKQVFIRVVNEDLAACLPRVQASTLLIWGDQDRDTPLWMGQRMEREIPDAGLVVFPGRGHYAYLEEAGRFAAVVDHFLSEEEPT